MGDVRDFNCPLTDRPCTDGRCRKGQLCCESERLDAASSRATTAKAERVLKSGVWETIGHRFERKNPD